MGPKKGPDGTLTFTLPMGDKKLPGIAAEDIGRCALGILKSGEYVGRTVGVAGQHLTGAEMAAKLTQRRIPCLIPSSRTACKRRGAATAHENNLVVRATKCVRERPSRSNGDASIRLSYPASGVYLNISMGTDFYLSGGTGQVSARLPSSVVIDTADYVSLELDTDKPYLFYDEHRVKFKGKKGHPKDKGKWKDGGLPF